MKVAFLMDPLQNINPIHDTTSQIMFGAHRKGHAIYYLPKDGIFYKNNLIFFRIKKLVPQSNASFTTEEEKTITENDLDVIFIRPNPPFDFHYLTNTWLLELISKKVLIINDPTGIRTISEKLWVTKFPQIIPKTLVSSKKSDFLDFLNTEKEVIIKPVDGFGGFGIFKLNYKDPNAHVAFEALSEQEKKYVVVQKFIPQSEVGDKRILLLNGEPIGFVLRIHSQTDHRNNFFSGGRPEKTKLTKRDWEIINILKPHLQKLGVYFAGIDIIGDLLLEVNVTSPGCIPEINELYSLSIEDKIIEFIERKKK